MFSKFLFPVYKSHFTSIWKTVQPSILSSAAEKFAAPNIDIVRFRARKGTRLAKLAKVKANKAKKANQPQPIPKHLQRKVKTATELLRTRCTDENWHEERPIDNVWNMKMFRGKPYSVAEAVKILQDTHMPSLLNEPSALIYVTAELDLKLKKKDRFMDEFNGIITYPHEFDSGKKNKVLVVCKESQDQIAAADAGAVLTGSTALIKQILSGVLTNEDFDYVICHPDMYKELNVLRGILKKKFPNSNNGLLRLDIDRAVKSFIKSVEYTMKRSALEPDFGWVEVCCGRLDMPLNEIEENIKFALNRIQTHKPAGTSHLFIGRSLLRCLRSKERIKIPHWEYLPNYPENGILIEPEEDEAVTSA